MPPTGIQTFYYGKNLPARAIAIAQVTAEDVSPADLIDIVNTPYLPGSLGIWKASEGLATSPNFTAPDYNQSVTITGDVLYMVQNQFFQITNQFAADGVTPLYFYHNFGQSVSGATILNLDGSVVTPAPTVLFSGNWMYHDVPSALAFQVRYVDSAGRVQISLLHYNQVMPLSTNGDTSKGYAFTGGMIELASAAVSYSIRFLVQNGYQALPPYEAPSYLPWFPRVRFSLQPPALEYPIQSFLPTRPYLLGYWIPGTVLAPNLIQFDRQGIYNDPNHLPDIVVFDSNQEIKYAMDGSANGEPETHGTLYPWKRNQISDVDPFTGRVAVVPTVLTTDTVYGFYSYFEPDVVYTALDVNPVTNPNIKNTVICFYYRATSNPLQEIYHQVFNDSGPIAGMTNDPNPPTWSGQTPASGTVFAEMVVGVSFGIATFEMTDVRTRGGGLAPAYQTIPQADNFWDLGYLDGRPYPVGGALVVYLPTRILNTMTRDVVAGIVNSVLPMGTIAAIRYYDPEGNESV